VAHAWLGETITSTPPALAGEVIALIVMTGGIVALAHRAPRVTSRNPELSAAAGPEMTPGSLESPPSPGFDSGGSIAAADATKASVACTVAPP
jgi:hypothetical protein